MNWQSLWSGRAQFTIFDSAYGDGQRFRAIAVAWRADPQRPARLHYIGVGASALPGFRRVPQQEAALTLDIASAPLDSVLAQLDARLDAILLGPVEGSGFARALARLASPGAVVRAAGLNDTQAHALGGAGFDCRAGAGGVLDAVFTSRKPAPPWARKAEPVRRAIVLGAGLAGSAACQRLCARGWEVTLVERHAEAATEASGNLAGIFMPLLSKDDNIMTRLSRASYLYALAYWDWLGGFGGQGMLGAQCGVLQLARDSRHAAVQQAIAQVHGYPAQFAHWLTAQQALDRFAVPAPHGAWWFAQAGWARPASVCAAMLDACGPGLVRRFGVGSVSLERHEGEWLARSEGGAPIASAPVVVLANGTGAMQLAQAADLPLQKVRGQVTHLPAGSVPEIGVVLCREAYLTPATDGWHSLGASYDDDDDPQLRMASQAENLEKIRSLLGQPGIGTGAALGGRVGFRCVAPDRLPLVGALADRTVGTGIERLRQIPRQPGLYGLLGYASRGLTWAPLAAELLASQLNGDPLPLEADLATALDPARFILRARRRAL